MMSRRVALLDAQSAFILPTVLWVLALLSAIVLAIAASTRLDVRAQANLLSSERARLLVDGATRGLAFRIASGAPLSTFRSGRVVLCDTEEARLALMVTDAAGLIDLNASPMAEFRKLLRGVGLEPEQASSLAEAIVDARDGDDITQSGHQEREAYLQSGLPFGAKNLPFESVSELDQVPGMSPDLIAKIEPFLTVHSRRPAIDARVAPPALLQILDSGRQDGHSRELSSGPELRSRLQEIRIYGEMKNGARAARHAVVEIDGKSRRGMLLREWRSPSQASSEALSLSGEVALCANSLR